MSEPRIAIIGGGPGGLCAGIKLREAGYSNFEIIEKSGGVGGTWYNTRYPGLACDVKAHIYTFSFEPNPDWSREYAHQPEILAYMEHCARKYGLEPHLRLDSEIEAARWSDADSEWLLTTSAGGEIRADIVIAALGMFNELQWPKIKGLGDFGGTLFHSARWREELDFKGRKVAVIGSAASAVQFVPKIAPEVAHLHVFQRSAPWILPKPDVLFSKADRARLENDPEAVEAYRRQLYDELEGVITFSNKEMLDASERAGLENLKSVADPVVRAKLTPHVPFGCLRPLVSNEYYPTFNRSNVELVTEPIARVVPQGVETADGRLREVDTVICATGYQVQRYLSAIEVHGRGGLALTEAWADGPEAYLGLMTAGFPNLFMLYGPNTNNGSLLRMEEAQADFIVNHLKLMQARGLPWIDIRRDVMARYNERLQGELDKVGVWQANCSNYYRTASGRIVTQWPLTMTAYRERCAAVDEMIFETPAKAAAE